MCLIIKGVNGEEKYFLVLLLNFYIENKGTKKLIQGEHVVSGYKR